MATKIRLRRTGTTNLALFRIVVADARAPRDGRFIETLGHYDPRKEGKDKVTINAERLLYWLGVGAQMTEAVEPLVKLQGIEIPKKTSKRKKRAKNSVKTETSATTETQGDSQVQSEQTADETPAAEPETKSPADEAPAAE